MYTLFIPISIDLLYIDTNKNKGTPWVQAWDIIDNAFYHVLLDDGTSTVRGRSLNWTQLMVENITALQHEWRSMGDGSSSGSRFVMLNSDMALLKDIDNNLDQDIGGGKCPLTYAELPNNSISAKWVQEYADDNQLWLTHFGKAFRKMLLTGYQYKIENLSVL